MSQRPGIGPSLDPGGAVDKHRSSYCWTHDSLLCARGQGLCQVPVGARCRQEPIGAPWMMERGYRCAREDGHDGDHGFRPPRVFVDEEVAR